MAGRIRQLIDEIIRERAGTNEVITKITKTRLLLKGIDSDIFTAESDDDPVIIARLEEYAKLYGSPSG